MKKTVFLAALIATYIIILLFTRLPKTLSANAKEENFSYAQVIADDCAFYSDASLKIVRFYLPKTYAVKIVSIGTECSRVIYMDDAFSCPFTEGYVKNVCLSFLNDTPKTISPTVKLTVNCDEVIFADTFLSQPKAVITALESGYYYGELTIGAVSYVYLYISGYVGYMRKDCFNGYTIPENLIIVETPPETPTTDSDSESTLLKADTEKEKQNFSAAETLIVAVIVIAGLSGLFLIISKNSQNKGEKTYFEDE